LNRAGPRHGRGSPRQLKAISLSGEAAFAYGAQIRPELSPKAGSRFDREETVEELCVCSKRMLDIEHAAWVFRGRPCCNGSCYRKAVEADDRKMALRNLARRQEETRHAAL
jgi:hypothetical protein